MATLTLGLQNLRRQVDVMFPGRDKQSDGTIGDAAHRATTSGHNPDDSAGSRPAWNGDPDSRPEIRAWDMDSDLGGGVKTQVVVDHVRKLAGLSSVLRYLIYNRKIYHSDVGFAPAPYTGESAHTEHVHFEGAWTQTADDNQSFNFRLEAIPVALTAADKTWIKATIDAAVKSAVDRRVGDVVPRWTDDGTRVPPTDGNPTMTVADGIFYGGANARRAENNTLAILAAIAKLSQESTQP